MYYAFIYSGQLFLVTLWVITFRIKSTLAKHTKRHDNQARGFHEAIKK